MTLVAQGGARIVRDGADLSAEARFGQRVQPLPNGCWAWDGDLTKYGSFTRSRRSEVRAHRFAYEVMVGPIPDGLVLHHRCENPGCVNPTHLEPMTPGDHMAEHARLNRTA